MLSKDIYFDKKFKIQDNIYDKMLSQEILKDNKFKYHVYYKLMLYNIQNNNYLFY